MKKNENENKQNKRWNKNHNNKTDMEHIPTVIIINGYKALAAHEDELLFNIVYRNGRKL